MDSLKQSARQSILVIVCAVTVLFACYSGSVSSVELKVALSGAQEIPPVTTSATGAATITVGEDQSISGNVTITGMSVTVAHIHEAAASNNGPIIIPLTKTSNTVWSVPAGAKLTDAQYKSFKAGNLYFNAHSDAHKGGEIRGQIKP